MSVQVFKTFASDDDVAAAIQIVELDEGDTLRGMREAIGARLVDRFVADLGVAVVLDPESTDEPAARVVRVDVWFDDEGAFTEHPRINLLATALRGVIVVGDAIIAGASAQGETVALDDFQRGMLDVWIGSDAWQDDALDAIAKWYAAGAGEASDGGRIEGITWDDENGTSSE